jgi:hypothetical protein
MAGTGSGMGGTGEAGSGTGTGEAGSGTGTGDIGSGTGTGGMGGTGTGDTGGGPAGEGPVALGLSGNQSIESGALTMFGDLSPLQLPGGTIPTPPAVTPGGTIPPPPPVTPGNYSAAPPSFIRGFKIADNQSPRPVNRVYYDFNYFDNVWQSVNERAQNGINRVQIYRQLLGLEKTFWDGNASIGVRLPINTITADGQAGGVQTPTQTAINNFNVYSKFLYIKDDVKKVYASWGLAATIPTGPMNFAGANYVRSYNNVDLQPFVGLQKTWNRFYLIAFEAINVPLNTHDVTAIYNDYAIGYWAYRAKDRNQLLQGLAPTFECHVNVPLNHRDVFNLNDRAGSADIVDLTYGLNTFFGKRTQMAFAAVTPVTGPRPFSIEALAFLNIYY